MLLTALINEKNKLGLRLKDSESVNHQGHDNSRELHPRMKRFCMHFS